MKRIDFLKKAGFGLIASATLLSCKKDEEIGLDTPTGTTGSSNGSSAANCTVTNSETEGPFPTKIPSSLQQTNIVSDRTGVPMTVKIFIKNKNGDCVVLKEAIVDIWHCDADGNYSQYGGTGLQSINYTSASFLRGRQVTDANGQVTFGSLFPGWYGGRAPHIHVHIYNATGKSLLVTQIAFPKEVCDNVYTKATSFYKKGTQDTTNERDNVFGDGYANELASIEGSISAGYTLTHTIVVNA